jgi:hypothetical protein
LTCVKQSGCSRDMSSKLLLNIVLCCVTRVLSSLLIMAIRTNYEVAFIDIIFVVSHMC